MLSNSQTLHFYKNSNHLKIYMSHQISLGICKYSWRNGDIHSKCQSIEFQTIPNLSYYETVICLSFRRNVNELVIKEERRVIPSMKLLYYLLWQSFKLNKCNLFKNFWLRCDFIWLLQLSQFYCLIRLIWHRCDIWYFNSLKINEK